MSKLDSLRQAVALSPRNIPLLMLFAEACLDEWLLTEAHQAFQSVLAVDSDHLGAQLGLIRVLQLENKSSEAFVRTEALLAKHPDCSAAYVILSRLHLSEGNRDEARSQYEKALSLDARSRDLALEKDLFANAGAALSEESKDPDKIKVTENGWQPAGPSKADGAMDVELPSLTFADIGGMEMVKEEIRMKIIHPLKNPELFRAYGKKIGGGVLLYGPPGCGKTLLSRATAGEIKASFLSVGIHQILDLYLGNSEKNLHQLFDLARSHAPAVLFFDEVDALAADRNDMKRSAGRTLINQFLAELDGNVGSNEGILVLGATNAPWHLDPAFRRPGRFDRILFVRPPDEAARRSIIEVMAKDKPIRKLDAGAIAKKTKDFSGADLKAVFDIAIERSLSQAIEAGRVIPLATDDLLKAVHEVKPSSRPWFESARNYAIYSNQSGFYDDVLAYLGLKK